MKINNCISLINPCSTEHHACQDFKTLKLRDKILVSTVTPPSLRG